MHSSIVALIIASIAEIKQDLKKDMTTQHELITTMIYAKLHIPADISLSNLPFHNEGETSSHSQNFQPH